MSMAPSQTDASVDAAGYAHRRVAARSGSGDPSSDHRRTQRGGLHGTARSAHGGAAVSGAGRGSPEHARRARRREQAGDEPVASQPRGIRLCRAVRCAATRGVRELSTLRRAAAPPMRRSTTFCATSSANGAAELGPTDFAPVQETAVARLGQPIGPPVQLVRLNLRVSRRVALMIGRTAVNQQ